MRILHTADWHVGKTLTRRSRIDESRAVLREIVDIGVKESVDAALICGDIFEHQSPSPDAEQVVYEALESFSHNSIPVVLIAGNHDHPLRWRALAPLLKRFDVHVVDSPRRPDDGGILEIPSRDGSDCLQVACLPWVPEKRIIGAHELMGLSEQPFKTYADEMARILASLCSQFDPSKCNVLAAHLFVSSSIISGSERTLTVGDIYGINPQTLPTAVQYTALGHVHKPQQIPASPIPARYAGSPLQLDFGEVGQQKSVSIVDLRPGLPAQVREIQLSAGRRLIDVAGSLQDLGKYTDTVENALLRVRLTCDGPQSGLSDTVREILPNALVVTLDYPRQDAEQTPADLGEIAPRQLFARYFRERHATDASPDLLNLFDEILDEVTAS
jgi:exonuclease SbcD